MAQCRPYQARSVSLRLTGTVSTSSEGVIFCRCRKRTVDRDPVPIHDPPRQVHQVQPPTCPRYFLNKRQRGQAYTWSLCRFHWNKRTPGVGGGRKSCCTRGRKNVPECGDPSVTLRVPAPLSGEPFPLLLWKASPERGGGPLAVEGSSPSQGNLIGRAYH